jgi:hypothetical protein
MQLTAKLIQILPLQTGTGKNGTWKKQDIILETDGQYPKKVLVSIWGDKINSELLIVDRKMKVDIDIESREYNGRWYTDIRAWNIQLDEIDDNKSNVNTPIKTEEDLRKILKPFQDYDSEPF